MDENIDLSWILNILSPISIGFALAFILGYALTEFVLALVAALICLTLSIIMLHIRIG